MYNYKILSVRLSGYEAEAVERLAKTKNLTVSELVRLVVAMADLWANGSRAGN